MSPQYIEFVQAVRVPMVMQYPRWHDRFRWWIVKKLGGENPHESVKVTRVPIDGKTFADRLFKQKRELFDSFRREPASLLIGAQDFEELMDSPEIQQSIRFQASFNYGRHEVYGLTVTVIPWMRGAVVMP